MSGEIQLPESLRKAAAPGAPLHMRLMLAKGQLPLGVFDKISLFLTLQGDPDQSVRDALEEGWKTIDARALGMALHDKSAPSAILDAAASRFAGDGEIARLILAHQNVSAATVCRFAASSDPAVLDRIAVNQRLLVENPDTARLLLENPSLDPAARSRLRSLLGLDAREEEPPVQAPAAEPMPEPPADLPEDLAAIEIPEEFSLEMPPELLEDEPGVEEAAALGAGETKDSTNLYQLIQTLSIAEKIKLATLGSKSARKLLSRDSNRIVVNAVIRSPKIRDDEVIPLAQDRTTPDDVLVYIMTRKEWMKNYQIRLALCKNPKTPLPRALRLLELVHEKDLRGLAKNRNIPQAVATAALRILTRRGQPH